MPQHRATQGPSADAGVGRSAAAEPLAVELREAIEQRRGHKALGLVKLLRKHPAYGPEHVPLVARAYELRLAEMNAAAQHKEAADLLRVLAEQQPAVAAQLSSRPALLVELGGGAGPLLARYGQDAALTAEIDRWVRHDCRDPRPLARHPALAASHPLKAAAIAVMSAWEEVERGAAAAAYARLSDAVGRRSPFVAWRLFVQALQAAYAGVDAEARTCLDRIADDCAVRPLADILERLLSDEPPRNTREAVLRARIAVPSLHGSLSEIDRLLASGHAAEAQRAFDETIRLPVWSGRDQLLGEVSARFLLALFPMIEAMDRSHAGRQLQRDVFSRFQRMPQFSKSIIKFLYWDNADTVEDWTHALEFAAPSLLAKALIFDRLATIELSQSADEDEDEDDQDENDGGVDAAHDGTAAYCRAVERWRQSVQAHALRETFVHWHAEARRRGADVETALAAWSQAFPEDETPLLELTAMYRANRTPQKALSMFKRLEGVARGRPEVEALRPFLRLDSAAGRLARGIHGAAEKDVNEIGPDAPEFVRVACATLRWICARRDGGDAAARLAELDAAGRPLWVAHTMGILGWHWRMDLAVEAAGTEARLTAQARTEPARMAMDYAALVRMPDAVWSAKRSFPTGVPIAEAFRSRAIPAAALWDVAEGLFKAPLLAQPRARALFWALTGNGLARRDARTPEYLAYRALLYDPFLAPHEEMLACDKAADRVNTYLAVAQRLAQASGRMDAVQAVEALGRASRCAAFGRKKEARLTDADCARVLDQESAIDTWAGVPARLKDVKPRHEDAADMLQRLRRNLRVSRRSRTLDPSVAPPDMNQPELW